MSTVIFSSRQAFIYKVYEKLNMLSVFQEFRANETDIDLSFVDKYYVLDLFSNCNKTTLKDFVVVAANNKKYLRPKPLQDIDKKYYFTKEDDASIDIASPAFVPYQYSTYKLFPWSNDKHIKTTYINNEFQTIDSSNHDSSFGDLKKYVVCRNVSDVYKHLVSSIGGYDGETRIDEYGWHVEARFNNRPKICHDNKLFETRRAYSVAFETSIIQIRLKGVQERLLTCKPSFKY